LALLAERWRLPDRSLYEKLIACYSEAHRRYHTLRHLEECFARFDEIRDLARHPSEVEIALWFHDAIYDPRRDDNEERSADWARSSVPDASAGERVHALVMATRHDAVPAGIDARVLLDVDLAILGADAQRFDQYEIQVREEHSWVPLPIYRQKRRQILQSFLARPTIYGTARFIGEYEARARANLARALARL
jgi:predicted metal-dependent HD superfamily phosphohydrolase